MKLEAVDVHKNFGHVEVLKGINLDVSDGEVVCLIGPSGSGKSTFLRCINQLEDLTSGAIFLDGRLQGSVERKGMRHALRPRELAAQRRRMGMVFQSFNLFPHMTALQNITCAQRIVMGRARAESDQRAAELLRRVGLGHRGDAYPAQLSGGQQQRVAIARALAMDPTLMLFDEPTSALDPELVGEVLNVIRALADDGMTMVIVTHEIRFARNVADRVVFMDDGNIVEAGAPAQVIDNPQHQRTQAFLRQVS